MDFSIRLRAPEYAPAPAAEQTHDAAALDQQPAHQQSEASHGDR